MFLFASLCTESLISLKLKYISPVPKVFGAERGPFILTSNVVDVLFTKKLLPHIYAGIVFGSGLDIKLVGHSLRQAALSRPTTYICILEVQALLPGRNQDGLGTLNKVLAAWI